MLYTSLQVLIVVGVIALLTFSVYQGAKIILQELQNQARSKRRQLFRRYFGFIPSEGKPDSKHLAKVRLALHGLADEVHQHHRQWITDEEIMAPDAMSWIHQKLFIATETEFNRALRLAQEFGFIKPCYTSYHHFLVTYQQEETKVLQVSLEALLNHN